MPKGLTCIYPDVKPQGNLLFPSGVESILSDCLEFEVSAVGF